MAGCQFAGRAYIGLLEQRLLAAVTVTLTMATRVTLLAGAQVGHQRIPRVLVHGVDRAQGFATASVLQLRTLEATQQALNVKVGANAAEPPMGCKIWGNI
jgi:hypothetical protein